MMTGLRERLNQELDELVEELTVRIPTQLGEDQRIEDHEVTLATQQHIQRRIQFLHHTLSALDSVDQQTMPTEGAGFGSTVRLRDLRAGGEVTYILMTGDALDLEAGQISLASPVGHALLGRKEGDEIEVVTPVGRRHFRIVSVTTLHDGVADRRPVFDVRCA